MCGARQRRGGGTVGRWSARVIVAGWWRLGDGSGREAAHTPQHLPIVSAGVVVLNSARSTTFVGSSCAMATTKVVPPPSQAAYTVGMAMWAGGARVFAITIGL